LRYIIGENPVDRLAFGLFVLIVFAAVLGPPIVPYDPLASDTAAALKPSRARTGSAPTGSAATCSAAWCARLDFIIAVFRWFWCS
jgi:peptide/nickel transport system permease protein